MVPSLWDVEDTDASAIKVRDMTVAPVEAKEVREFARRYHYTGHAGADLWRWGLWHGPTLLGVVSYNNGTKDSAASVFGEENKAHVWHMGRLALADECPRNSESRLIGGSLRAIAADWPEVWAVLTYAATTQGHLGYVYQATNALYTGVSAERMYYTDTKGRTMTQRPGRYQLKVADAAARGWTKHLGGVKHRYVYVLGSKTQRKERMRLLRLRSLPYPKEVPS